MILSLLGTNEADQPPTSINSFKVIFGVDGKKAILKILDTSGDKDLARLRQITYKDASIYLVCFSLVDHESLAKACGFWVDELIEFGSPNSTKVLVGLKLDLRNEWLQQPDK